MENMEIYLSYIAIILSLLVSTITFIIKFIKSIKEKKDTLNLLSLSDTLIPLIEEAEKFINFSKDVVHQTYVHKMITGRKDKH